MGFFSTLNRHVYAFGGVFSYCADFLSYFLFIFLLNGSKLKFMQMNWMCQFRHSHSFAFWQLNGPLCSLVLLLRLHFLLCCIIMVLLLIHIWGEWCSTRAYHTLCQGNWLSPFYSDQIVLQKATREVKSSTKLTRKYNNNNNKIHAGEVKWSVNRQTNDRQIRKANISNEHEP